MVHHTLHKTVTQLDYIANAIKVLQYIKMSTDEKMSSSSSSGEILKEKVDPKVIKETMRKLNCFYFQDDFSMQHPSTTSNIAH